jgi:opacity protein-like surface antigen
VNRTILSLIFLAIVCCDAVLADNFYIGGSYGRQTLATHASFTTDALLRAGPFAIPQVGVTVNSRTENTNNSAALFMGHGWDFDRFVLNLEGDVNLNSAVVEPMTIDINFMPLVQGLSITNTKMSIEQSYGLSLLPAGYVTKDWLIYARLGMTRNKIRIATDSLLFSPDQNYYRNGTRFGIGTEYFLNSNLGVRIEYSFFRHNGNIAQTDLSTLATGINVFGVSEGVTYSQMKQYLCSVGLKF